MDIRTSVYFKQGEEFCISPVHNFSHTLHRWAHDEVSRAYVSASGPDTEKDIYEVESLRHEIDQCIELVGQGTDIGWTNEQLADIKRQVVTIYLEARQYGITHIQFQILT